MKQLYILLSILFTLPLSTQAAHLRGGEITWKCLSNGKYQFYMYIYRECMGTPFQYVSQTIDVDGTGIPITSIPMEPDSAKFLAMNDGNISHFNPSGNQASCLQNPTRGVIQAFPFVSDTVTLGGVPPASGVNFSWKVCCRSNSTNIINPNTKKYYLHAIMYPYENQNLNICYDNSPEFLEVPTQVIAKGNPYSYSNAALDMDLDSLVYSFDTPLSDDLNDPVVWKTGYSAISPFPNSTHNPMNVVASINNKNGLVMGAVYSGFHNEEYSTLIRVDSYRKGIKIASIWRDMVVSTLDQPPLPGIGLPNNPPKVEFNGIPGDVLQKSIDVKDKALIPIQIIETDLMYDDPNDPATIRIQKVVLTAKGLFFSNDFVDSANCALSNLSPCATLTPTLTLNSNTNQYELVKPGTVTTIFEWQTSCDLLKAWEDQKYFNFVLGIVDDQPTYTPVVKKNATITVEVNRKQTEIVQNGNQLTVLDTGVSYQWYRNDTLLPNDSSTILIDKTGMYAVVVDGNSSCAYQKALYNVEGCVVINDIISHCDSIIWRDGITYTKSTTTPTFVLPNSNGCDTVVKLNLTIQDYGRTEVISSCGDYTWIDGITYSKSTTTPTFSVQNQNGCDTTIKLDLTIKNTTREDSVVSCISYTWIDGITYTESNDSARFVLPNSVGCDSIISLKLTIKKVDTTYVNHRYALMLNQDSATYQWLNCKNAMAKIPGANGIYYSPSKNGQYACEIRYNGCIDTTFCKDAYFIGLEELLMNNINIYPNPSTGNFIVELQEEYKGKIELKLNDLNGKEVVAPFHKKQNSIQIESEALPIGVYFLSVVYENQRANFKLVKL